MSSLSLEMTLRGENMLIHFLLFVFCFFAYFALFSLSLSLHVIWGRKNYFNKDKINGKKYQSMKYNIEIQDLPMSMYVWKVLFFFIRSNFNATTGMGIINHTTATATAITKKYLNFCLRVCVCVCRFLSKVRDSQFPILKRIWISLSLFRCTEERSRS